MMRSFRQKIIFAVMLCTSLAFLLSGMAVYARSLTETEGSLSLGAVRVELTAEQTDATPVLPGQRISYVPQITNQGYPCFIRAKYDLARASEYVSPEGFADGWRAFPDGYWYYILPLAKGSTVDFFRSLSFSPEMPDTEAGRSVTVEIIAEAVQARNFSPDFSGVSPWGETEIEKYTKTRDFTVSEGMSDRPDLFIRYLDESDTLIADPNNFFRDIPTLLPGDTYSQTAVLTSSLDQPLSLCFYSETPLDDALLKKALLRIETSDQGVVYDGSLEAASVNGSSHAVLLSEISAGTDRQMTFTIHMPESLKNEYTHWKSRIKWVFFTNRDPHIPATVSSPAPVRTGDDADPGFYLMFAGIALLIMTTVMWLSVRKGRRS